jgi:hypothetical protein
MNCVAHFREHKMAEQMMALLRPQLEPRKEGTMPAESNQTYSVEAPEINDDLAILADEPSGGNDEGKAPRQTSQTPGTEDGDDLQEEVEEKPEPEVKEEEADEEEKPESKAKVEESGDDGSLPLSKRLEKISPES